LAVALAKLDPLGEQKPDTPALTPSLVTKKHRRFVEFSDACRRHRYNGLSYGPPGVGKTLSVRQYAHWDDLEPRLWRWRHHFTEGRDRDDWSTVFYTPTVNASPRVIDKELRELFQHLAVLRAEDALDKRGSNNPHGSAASKSPVSRHFRSTVDGEWSETMVSIRPSASRRESSSRFAPSRIGGQHLKRMAPSGYPRWRSRASADRCPR